MSLASDWRTATEVVPVDGGVLHAARLSTAVTERAPAVIALHGITGNSLAFLPIAQLLTGRLSLWAPDLRGRGESRLIEGPFGIGQHADDVVRLMDHLGLDQVVLLGHSMGATVGSVVAARHPDRVAGLVMVDGGISAAPPSWHDPDAFMRFVLGPAVDRLTMTFRNLADYLAYWSAHPGLGPSLAGAYRHFIQTYLAHDLVPDGEAYRSSCMVHAVRADGASMAGDPEVLSAPFHALRQGVPMQLLWAPRGALNQPVGLYGGLWPGNIDLPEGLRNERVPDANHYTVIFEPAAARRVAHRVLETAGLVG